jgi:uncharacterized membrane protein
MFDMGLMNLWIHILSLCFYFGCVAVFLFLFLPSIDAIEDTQSKGDLLIRGLRRYNPIQIGSLGVLVMTGAFNLTRYKAKGVEIFLGSFGSGLVLKLGLVFILIILSLHQTMAIAHPAVRRHRSNGYALPYARLVKRLRMTSWAILLLTAGVTLVGLMLTHQ